MSISVDIRALAQLARIEIDEASIPALEAEVRSILDFVGTVQEVASGTLEAVAGTHRNIMRADEPTHILGEHTDILLAEAPAQEHGYIQVRRVITGGKHKE